MNEKAELLTIANCIAGAVAFVVSAPLLIVMSFRTLMLFEISNDNMYQPLYGIMKFKKTED